jgi:hypothetical protein
MAELKQIREAIIRNHGGLEQATDGQILTVWNALDAATQQRYLKLDAKTKEADNAVRG